MSDNKSSSPRVVAIVGPFHSGKTSLLESILCLTGKEHRKAVGARVFGDLSVESKAREMGVDMNIGSTQFMDDDYVFLDCPGSPELFQESRSMVRGIDAAIVVVEPELDKIAGLAPMMKLLELNNVPHFIFVNKIDKAHGSVRDLAESLQAACSWPVVLRHIPLRDGENITGYVDLASKRAFTYGKGQPSTLIDAPEDEEARIADARFTMLETLADFDDHLMEELLEDVDPPTTEVYGDLAKDMAKGHIVPVMMGAAITDNGVFRLLKALRHEVPGIEDTRKRNGVSDSGDFLGLTLKTFHTAHGGKRSIVRVLRGEIKDGTNINGDRVSGIGVPHGEDFAKKPTAIAGDLVAFARMEKIKTGDILTTGDESTELDPLEILSPVYSLAIKAENRNDEVKLATSLARVHDEDPALTYRQTEDTHQLILDGQGEVHLKITMERLKNKYGLSVNATRPRVPYKETIKKSKTQHSRFKKQSGGHGQFGDVVVDIAPLPLGTGFTFTEKIHGGSVPKQYIPSVETGIKNFLDKGPLGFPVVDVGVTLTDGKYHAVDSSDMAFQMAGRLAMSEALPECAPVLLEPIMHVKVQVPNEFTAKVNSLVSGRRGQIMGFDARAGWDGWDEVEARMPLSEMHDMIIELRSMTAGSGTYTSEFDKLSELTGRLADNVLAAHAEEAH